MLGNFLYTFGGRNLQYSPLEDLNSVEWIELREVHGEQMNQEWQLAEFDPVTLAPRWRPVFCPLNETEILIVGGRYWDTKEYVGKQRNDVIIFNTEDRSVATLFQNGVNDLKFECFAN